MAASSTGLTLKQERLVQAVLDPTTESVSEAGRKAGYRHAQSTHRALNLAETQRELAARRDSKRDKASRLLDRGLVIAGEHLNRRDADPDYALKASLTAAQVLEKVGLEEEEALVATHPPEYYAALIRRGLVRAERIGYARAKAGLPPIERVPARYRITMKDSSALTMDDEALTVDAEVVE